MIDWNKPIETVDGREAKFVKEMMTGCIVYVLQQSGRRGDVFLVNDKGCRRDDRASDSEQEKPIIRNARVKREGWARVNSNNGLPFMPGDVVFSDKAAAESACQRLGGVPAFVTWEE